MIQISQSRILYVLIILVTERALNIPCVNYMCCVLFTLELVFINNISRPYIPYPNTILFHYDYYSFVHCSLILKIHYI